MKREIVETMSKTTSYSVRQICDRLGINRSLLYYSEKSDPTEAALIEKIETLSLRYPKYGYRRITALLQRQGDKVGQRRVARLMKEANLSVSVKRACRTTTISGDGSPPWGNKMHGLEVCRSDQVWVADITYVRLKHRFVYLAMIMDVYTRMIRAWHLSPHLMQELTLKPLQEALSQSVPEIHHSDQGVQYLSKVYISTLQHHGVEVSVAQKGCPWENGYAERLIRTLKEEEVYLNDYEDIHEARDRIGHFIEQVYNMERPHSALEDSTPIEFQRKNLS